MVSTTATEEEQIRRTYAQLTFLGLILHTAQAFIYHMLTAPLPAIYNCMSVVFYALMLYLTQRKRYRTAVCAIHIETCLFALCCTISYGWDTGIPLFLLAISSLVYFCPFEHKFIPYLFSLAELILFVALRIYVHYYEPLYGYLPKFTEMAYYIFNGLACFCIILFAAFFSNISAKVTNIRLRNENKDLSVIANSDFLTGLPSRRAFLQRAKTLPVNIPVIAAIGDLDNFKNIHDSFGHSSGDYVLRTVGYLINSACDKASIACRWGGEEFVLLFYGCSPAHAAAVLESLRKEISAHIFEHEEQSMNVTITFGAYSGMIGDGIEELINEADKYLYLGKQSGKNCVATPFEDLV